MTDISTIKAVIPISSVLPQTADNACPFCKSHRFRVSDESGLYSCPDCGNRGDVISATMALDRVDFRTAVTRLRVKMKDSNNRAQ